MPSINTSQWKAALVHQEIGHIIGGLYARHQRGCRTQIQVCDELSWILFHDFPLPWTNPDRTPLLVSTALYPKFPPHGVHIPTRAPALPVIEQVLGGYVFDDPIQVYDEHVERLKNKGFSWVCYHHVGYQWRFNARDFRKGDCLYKYLENFYAVLAEDTR